MREMTTERTAENEDATANHGDTMADVSHANPYTGSTLGDVFRRGPKVADGGTGGSESDESATIGEIDHAPRNGDVNDVWIRGGHGSGVSSEIGDDE